MSSTTELCVTVSKSKASSVNLQGWGAASCRIPPREIMAYNNNDKNNNLYQCGTKSSPESRGGTPATWSSVEDIGLSKPKGNVWNIPVHHTRTSFGEVWKGQTCWARSWILGLSRSPIRSPVKQFGLTQLGSAKQLARGTIRATGAWIETFQHTNENQGLQQTVLKKVD